MSEWGMTSMEVIRAVGVTARHLQNWDERGWVSPDRRYDRKYGGEYRVYRSAHLWLVLVRHACIDAGITRRMGKLWLRIVRELDRHPNSKYMLICKGHVTVGSEESTLSSSLRESANKYKAPITFIDLAHLRTKLRLLSEDRGGEHRQNAA
jgi:DNA-binding transcriptional MerR regulator